jgi:hypothetical protein
VLYNDRADLWMRSEIQFIVALQHPVSLQGHPKLRCTTSVTCFPKSICTNQPGAPDTGEYSFSELTAENPISIVASRPKDGLVSQKLNVHHVMQLEHLLDGIRQQGKKYEMIVVFVPKMHKHPL